MQMGINSIRYQPSKLKTSGRGCIKEETMFTVESHEYDADTGIDSYVLNPGNMKVFTSLNGKVDSATPAFPHSGDSRY